MAGDSGDEKVKRVHFIVRPARESDNEALVELDRRCTMGEETIMAFVRSHDFFARSKPYEQPQLLVAEADNTILGVGGAALKPLRVGAELLKAAYFYDLRVDPAFRRLGVASAIGDALIQMVKQKEADFTFSLILEGNVPSLGLWQNVALGRFDGVPWRSYRPARREERGGGGPLRSRISIGRPSCFGGRFLVMTFSRLPMSPR